VVERADGGLVVWWEAEGGVAGDGGCCEVDIGKHGLSWLSSLLVDFGLAALNLSV